MVSKAEILSRLDDLFFDDELHETLFNEFLNFHLYPDEHALRISDYLIGGEIDYYDSQEGKVITVYFKDFLKKSLKARFRTIRNSITDVLVNSSSSEQYTFYKELDRKYEFTKISSESIHNKYNGFEIQFQNLLKWYESNYHTKIYSTNSSGYFRIKEGVKHSKLVGIYDFCMENSILHESTTVEDFVEVFASLKTKKSIQFVTESKIAIEFLLNVHNLFEEFGSSRIVKSQRFKNSKGNFFTTSHFYGVKSKINNKPTSSSLIGLEDIL